MYRSTIFRPTYLIIVVVGCVSFDTDANDDENDDEDDDDDAEDDDDDAEDDDDEKEDDDDEKEDDDAENDDDVPTQQSCFDTRGDLPMTTHPRFGSHFLSRTLNMPRQPHLYDIYIVICVMGLWVLCCPSWQFS